MDLFDMGSCDDTPRKKAHSLPAFTPTKTRKRAHAAASSTYTATPSVVAAMQRKLPAIKFGGQFASWFSCDGGVASCLVCHCTFLTVSMQMLKRHQAPRRHMTAASASFKDLAVLPLSGTPSEMQAPSVADFKVQETT